MYIILQEELSSSFSVKTLNQFSAVFSFSLLVLLGLRNNAKIHYTQIVRSEVCEISTEIVKNKKLRVLLLKRFFML